MKLLAVLSCLVLVRADDPTVYLIREVLHLREIIWKNIIPSFNLVESPFAINYKTHNLYIAQYDNILREPAIYNIDTGNIKFIKGIEYVPDGIAVDQTNDDVYISTVHGIYKYNNDKTELVVNDLSIRGVFIRNELYYSKYHTGEMYKFVDTFSSINRMTFSVHHFVVDHEYNFVYISRNKDLYIQRNNTKHAVPLGGVTANFLTTDRHGKVYVSANDGIYVVNIKKYKIEKVVEVGNPREIVFDNDNNIIYFNRNDSNLYRLKPVGGKINAATLGVSDPLKDDSILKKIDELAGIVLALEAKIDKMQTELQKVRIAEEKRSTQWIRLETGNMPICVGDAAL